MITINKPQPVATIDVRVVKNGTSAVVQVTDNQTGRSSNLFGIDNSGRLFRYSGIPASLGFALDRQGRLQIQENSSW